MRILPEEKLIFALSQGAEHNPMTYEAYDINGYTFYTKEKDMKSDDYQNSGVTMESYTGNDKDRAPPAPPDDPPHPPPLHRRRAPPAPSPAPCFYKNYYCFYKKILLL